jgi:hypothetical protein
MIAGISNSWNSRRLSELPTNQSENTKKIVVAWQILDTSDIARLSKNKLAFLALKTLKLHIGWLEHL